MILNINWNMSLILQFWFPVSIVYIVYAQFHCNLSIAAEPFFSSLDLAMHDSLMVFEYSPPQGSNSCTWFNIKYWQVSFVIRICILRNMFKYELNDSKFLSTAFSSCSPYRGRLEPWRVAAICVDYWHCSKEMPFCASDGWWGTVILYVEGPVAWEWFSVSEGLSTT